MRAYFNQLPAVAWVALGVPVLLVAHDVFSRVVLAVICAAVPETIRTVLHLL